MLLSPHQIAQSREHALNNLLGVSSACLDASQRMSDLLAVGSRANISRSSRHMEVLSNGEFDLLAESIRLMWNDKTESSQFIEQFFEILGNTHKALIEAAEAQVRVFDEIVLASISRVSNFSPRETEIAFDAMRSSLEGAERTLHGMSNVAIQTVELAEQEIHQLSDSLANKSKTTKKTPIKSRKKAEE